MEISLNWLKDYCDITLSPAELETGLTQLGLECTYDSQTLNFTNVVLGHVLECDPHPNAETLSVCLVDIGDEENYQIVCGAPNVRQGIRVPVARVGATFNGGEFKIKKSKLRGVVSNGMICSGKELGYNDDHEGILVVESDAPLGTPIEDILDFNRDTVFHLDITPNRGDCFSHLGVAREVAILENRFLKQRPVIIEEGTTSAEDQIRITIQNPEGCFRYAARVITGVKVGPSPKWLRDRLESVGQKSINNVVDAANFVLMDMGHPMHTFDLDKLKSRHINVRFAENGEKITLLDETERELTRDHLLICDGETPVALAGIMGDLHSGISDDTTAILIESAYFEPTVIRKGAKLLDLSTEASKRFERDTDMENIVPAMDKLASLIVEVAGGEVAAGIIDIYPRKKESVSVAFRPERCNLLLGTSLTEQDMLDILKKLNITVTPSDAGYSCNVPSYRNDLTREVDLFEEVARVYGYDDIPVSHEFHGSLDAFIEDKHALDEHIRRHLSAVGFSEHYSNSLMPEEILSHFSDAPGVYLKNPLSQEMAVLRNSIFPGLLNAVAHNEKRQQKGFRIFEIGAVHRRKDDSPRLSSEEFHLGMAWHVNDDLHWRAIGDYDIYRVKGEIGQFLASIGCRDFVFKPEPAMGLVSAMGIYYKGNQIGVLGSLAGDIQKYYDISGTIFVFQTGLDKLSRCISGGRVDYRPPSQYPAVSRDIALLVDKGIESGVIRDAIASVGGKLLKDIVLFDYYESDSLGNNKKSLAYSLKFQSEDKTLRDKAVDKLMKKVAAHLKQKFGAVQR